MRQLKAGSCTLIFCLFLWTWLFSFKIAYGAENEQSVNALVENGGFLFTSGGSIAGRLNSTHFFIPASIIKIATALAALEILGPDYRYQTEFYLRDQATLYIKGHGDPFLTSEYIADIARTLKDKGLSRIDKLVLDGSWFSGPTAADGTAATDNPYDVPNGALAVNFNTLSIRVDSDRSVSSAEPQTPMLPLTRIIGEQLEPGRHRVNVSSFASRANSDNSQRYAAELFAAFLRRAGVAVGTAFESGQIDTGCILIYTFISPRTITDLVRDCLHYSNNFIANQLYLSCGTALFDHPATWDKGRRALHQVLTERFFLDDREFDIYEGSGVSRQTRVTPRFMLALLEAFRPYRYLLPEKDGMLLKSGTMTGVYCYAGYFISGRSSDPFVIMLNQRQNTRQRILTAVHGAYQQGQTANH